MVRLLAFLLAVCGRVFAQNSFWNDSVVPDIGSISDTRELTLGLSFTSDVPGSVTGVRFYKGSHKRGCSYWYAVVWQRHTARHCHVRSGDFLRVAAGELFIADSHFIKYSLCDLLFRSTGELRI
jgi:hypothetical protein